MAASALSAYCYGEAACLVFSVWAHGFDADGNILWDREPEFESQKAAIPRVLTDIQEDGNALQFDGAFKALRQDRGIRRGQAQRIREV